MKFEPIPAVLRDGTSVLLRPTGPDDAQQMLQYLETTSAQTPFMVRYPDEVGLSLEEERDLLDGFLNSPYLVHTAAFTPAGALMGNCSVTRLSGRFKQAHRAELGIAVYQEYWGRGLGTLLITTALELARRIPGVDQVELGVMGKNVRAIPLYEKLGFVRFGQTPRAFRFRDGSYDTEILMAKRLE